MNYREKQREIATEMGFVRLLPINTDTFPEEEFNELWDRVITADYAFEDSTRGNKAAFAETMIRPGTYNFEIPGKVFGQLTNTAPGSNAHIHFISLSSEPTAHLVEAAREMFWFAFEKIGTQRLTATIPEFNKKVIRMATLLLMKFEGDMRKAFLYDKEYWDLHIYGFLASEYKGRK